MPWPSSTKTFDLTAALHPACLTITMPLLTLDAAPKPSKEELENAAKPRRAGEAAVVFPETVTGMAG